MLEIVGKSTDQTIKYDYQGLSTDTKPTSCNPGSTFYELNTKKVWLFSSNINAITTNGWWEV